MTPEELKADVKAGLEAIREKFPENKNEVEIEFDKLNDFISHIEYEDKLRVIKSINKTLGIK